MRRNPIRQTILAAVAAGALPALAAAQGTASLTPAFPPRGTTATVTYNATGGPLAAAPAVTMTVGFNGFQNAVDVPLTGAAPNWSGTFSVPANATGIDVVFKNPAGSIFDNNGGFGRDWHFVAAEALGFNPGAEKVPAGVGGGYLFRVWAPDVASMSVVGEFNSFITDRDLMVLDPATGVWSAHIASAAAGQEYKFLIDGTEYRRDPRGRQVRGGFDNSVIVDPSAFTFTAPRAGTADSFRDWVVYEMHVGSLDSAGGRFTDLVPGRLDYLEALGVNAVHLMPVNEFPGSFSGGYNPTELFAIERAYGTPDEFRAFVEACHARGIAVIVDVVHNHYGPGGLDLYDFQDLNRNSLRDAPGIYFYDSPPELAETPFGPRPDYSEPQVRDFIADSVRMFLDEYNVDGFRWDFTKAIRGTVDGSFNITADLADGVSLLQDIHANIFGPNPDLFSTAEDLAGDARLTNPVLAVSGNPNDGFGFDSQWDGGFLFFLNNQLRQANDALIDMNAVAIAASGSFQRMHYVESHDEVWAINGTGKDRMPYRIDPADPESLRARKMSALGACLLFTTEGIPMLFMGSEILESGGADGSWDVDEPIDFSRLSDPDISGFRDLYSALIHLRRNLDGLSAGLLGDSTNVFHVNDTSKVIAYARSNGGTNPGDTVVVLANFSNTSFAGGYDIGLPEGGTWYEVLNSDDAAFGTDFGGVGAGQAVAASGGALHGFGQSGTVGIAPRSFVVLSRANPASAGVGDWRIFE
ncbi:MAG: alpha-amylase family glycosyl hydrolase [Candidatus Sumerlaeia bacterium]|nr:alpha-amylase family glycosyl hydrolase [Candidatus Sumerlaeia bacterium]